MSANENGDSGPAVAPEDAPVPVWRLDDDQGEDEQLAVRRARLEGLRRRVDGERVNGDHGEAA